MKTIKQIVDFEVPPAEVYEALMDSEKHAKFTSSKAKISTKIGRKFTAYDNYIYGTNIELVINKKIVQSWYCKSDGWPENHYSKLTIELKPRKVGYEKNGKEYFIVGTELVLTQENVPDACFEDISEGWEEHYWIPMKKMFEKNK